MTKSKARIVAVMAAIAAILLTYVLSESAGFAAFMGMVIGVSTVAILGWLADHDGPRRTG